MLVSRIYIDFAKLREIPSEFHYEVFFLSLGALLHGGLILMHDLRINPHDGAREVAITTKKRLHQNRTTAIKPWVSSCNGIYDGIILSI